MLVLIAVMLMVVQAVEILVVLAVKQDSHVKAAALQDALIIAQGLVKVNAL